MELIFVRHGQGEHTLHTPKSLQTYNPSLTEKGVQQAKDLRAQMPLTRNDLLVASPTRRTLQTAAILSSNVSCEKITTSLVSPRMFPQRSGVETLPCDHMMCQADIISSFPQFPIAHSSLFKSINVLPDKDFYRLAESFIKWCRKRCMQRIVIVSHDGTITSYRQLLSERYFNRNDFPRETGIVRMEV